MTQLVRDVAWEFFQKVTNIFPLDAEATSQAFLAAWTEEPGAIRETWEMWVRRSLHSAKKGDNPAGLLLYILKQGPDVDLTKDAEETVPYKRSMYRDVGDEMAKLRMMYAHVPLMPALTDGVAVYRKHKHLGWPAAKAALEEFYYHQVAMRDRESTHG